MPLISRREARRLDCGKDLSVKLALLLKDDGLQARGTERQRVRLSRLKYDGRTISEVEKLLQYENKKIVPGKKQVMVWMNAWLETDLFLKAAFALKRLE